MTTAAADMVAVKGNTYPVKDQLKALGARWDGDQRLWRVPAAQLAAAERIVAEAAGAPQPQKPFRPSVCKVCGVRASRNSRGYPVVTIYRSGECGDCYEERKMGY